MLEKVINHVIQDKKEKKRKINARKRFRRLGVWMIARKATSTPLNPKSKV